MSNAPRTESEFRETALAHGWTVDEKLPSFMTAHAHLDVDGWLLGVAEYGDGTVRWFADPQRPWSRGHQSGRAATVAAAIRAARTTFLKQTSRLI